jgi:hypothetical protein
VKVVRSGTAGCLAERLALGAAVLPAVVMAVRAAASGWVPLFDAAYFTVRSRDVATSHNPLVGAWSMGSREVGAWINNLGPLQLDVLAPFTKIDPYAGTAAGVAATNIASIVGVWLVSRRIVGPIGVVGAMAATVLIELNEGSLMLIEARQQLALVLPMWCVLWLAAAAWMGKSWALPWLALAASFVLQTHFTYAYQTVAVAVAATVALVLRHRRNLRDLAGGMVAAAAVTGACWALPLWDQLAGTGNLGEVFGQSGGSERSVGAARGLRILAESAFVPPFLSPGSMGDLLREGPRVSPPVAVVAIAAWAVLLVAAFVSMRRRHLGLAALAAIGIIALVGSIIAAIKIPPTEQFGIIAQNYYWAWPIATFMMTAIIGSTLRGRYRALRPTSPRATAEAVALVGAALTALAAAPLLRPGSQLPETDHEWAVSRDVARPLLDQLGASLDARDVTGPVLIDLGAVRHVRYTLLAELQRRGIDFVFSAGSTDLSRFGRDRCDDGTAAYLLTLRGGQGAVQLRSSDALLATAPGLTAEQAARSAGLAARFGDALRDGSISVDTSAIEFLGGDVPAALDQVLASPDLPARRLATFLADWSRFGAVEIAADLDPPFAEWEELERRAVDDRMAIYLRPISPHRPNLCAALEPGDDFLQGATT